MERYPNLLATFQPNQCQNASRKLHAGSPLCFRCVGRWRHASYYYVTPQPKVEITKALVRIPHKPPPNQPLTPTGRLPITPAPGKPFAIEGL